MQKWCKGTCGIDQTISPVSETLHLLMVIPTATATGLVTSNLIDCRVDSSFCLLRVDQSEAELL